MRSRPKTFALLGQAFLVPMEDAYFWIFVNRLLQPFMKSIARANWSSSAHANETQIEFFFLE